MRDQNTSHIGKKTREARGNIQLPYRSASTTVFKMASSVFCQACEKREAAVSGRRSNTQKLIRQAEYSIPRGEMMSRSRYWMRFKNLERNEDNDERGEKNISEDL